MNNEQINGIYSELKIHQKYSDVKVEIEPIYWQTHEMIDDTTINSFDFVHYDERYPKGIAQISIYRWDDFGNTLNLLEVMREVLSGEALIKKTATHDNEKQSNTIQNIQLN